VQRVALKQITGAPINQQAGRNAVFVVDDDSSIDFL
jgi:hypothetical protein